MGNPAGDGRLAGGRIPAGRECGPNPQAERLGRRCSRPSERRCAPGHAPDTRPRVRCITSRCPAASRGGDPAAGDSSDGRAGGWQAPSCGRPPHSSLTRPPPPNPGGRAADLVGTTVRQPMRMPTFTTQRRARAAIAGLEARAALIDRPALAQPAGTSPRRAVGTGRAAGLVMDPWGDPCDLGACGPDGSVWPPRPVPGHYSR
jgi:hypothetical protein